MARRRELVVDAVAEIKPDDVVIPAGPVAAAPVPVAVEPSAALLSEQAKIVAELEKLGQLKEAYDAARVVYNAVCAEIEAAQQLYLKKGDAWDALNRTQIAHDHAQPRVRELTKVLAAIQAKLG